MRRVTWPSWKQVRATTIVVIIAVFAFAAYFAVIDQIFLSSSTNCLTHSPSRQQFMADDEIIPTKRARILMIRRRRWFRGASPRRPAAVADGKNVHHSHLFGLRAESGRFATQPPRRSALPIRLARS